MKVYHIRKVLTLIILVLVSHHYSNFTVLSLCSSIDAMKKLRGSGNLGWGRAKKIQVSRKDPIALYASGQEQSDLLKWENMYRQGR
jgi:hypothetical protein